MSNILSEIIAHKQTEVAELDARALHHAVELAPRPRNFIEALTLCPSTLAGTRPNIGRGDGVRGIKVALIAELKRASPSKGMLAPQLDLFQVADLYAENGACALSVLTDKKFFLGDLETLYDLRFKRQMLLPLLRKDFIIDELQLYQSRAIGADAVLLIATALPDQARFAGLHALALELGLTPLVEVHDESELGRAMLLKDIRLIGINNRDLTTFAVRLETTERLRPMIPTGVKVVAESGIFTAQDVGRLAKANVDAVLVGEALVTAPDIAAKVRELSGVTIDANMSA